MLCDGLRVFDLTTVPEAAQGDFADIKALRGPLLVAAFDMFDAAYTRAASKIGS